MSRQKYSNGSLGKFQSKYANVNALTGDTTAKYNSKNTNASVTRSGQYGSIAANFISKLDNNSSISGSANRSKGGKNKNINLNYTTPKSTTSINSDFNKNSKVSHTRKNKNSNVSFETGTNYNDNTGAVPNNMKGGGGGAYGKVSFNMSLK